jgi:hypothetical protein
MNEERGPSPVQCNQFRVKVVYAEDGDVVEEGVLGKMGEEGGSYHVQCNQFRVKVV